MYFLHVYKKYPDGRIQQCKDVTSRSWDEISMLYAKVSGLVNRDGSITKCIITSTPYNDLLCGWYSI